MDKKRKNTVFLLIISGLLFIAVIICDRVFGFNPVLRIIIYIVLWLIPGYDIPFESFEALKEKNIFGEEMLMLIASFGAFCTNEYPEAFAVIFLFKIGELFEDIASDKSRKSIKALLDICPDYANIKTDEKIIKVKPENVVPGDTIIIKPGEKVPLDCTVKNGSSYVNTSALTGESVPVFASPGTELLSGYINGEGVLQAEATKKYEDSTAYRILELVENASERKAPTENFITKFAKYYTPCVVIAAFFLAVVPIIFGKNASEWIHRACTFLVISCPCALVISVPMGFFGGIAAASKCGILIKGGNFIEALSRISHIAFDKTGTLTKGTFEVTEVIPEKITEDELIFTAACAEITSNHPVANAIKNSCKRNIDVSSVTDIKEYAGKGIKANYKGTNILAGNKKLMSDFKIKVPDYKEIAATSVYVAEEGVYLGCIFISDTLKENSEKTLAELKKQGVKTITMLTGDKKSSAENVAELLGTDECFAELLPQDKVTVAQNIMNGKAKNETFAFVGDGINDAPVLMLSDVGIAMGGIGSDAATQAADIVIVDDDISKIPLAIKISRKTMRIVKANTVFSISVKLLVLLLGAFGIASMWLAVFSDVGVSVIAVINAMRTLKIKKQSRRQL